MWRAASNLWVIRSSTTGGHLDSNTRNGGMCCNRHRISLTFIDNSCIKRLPPSQEGTQYYKLAHIQSSGCLSCCPPGGLWHHGQTWDSFYRTIITITLIYPSVFSCLPALTNESWGLLGVNEGVGWCVCPPPRVPYNLLPALIKAQMEASRSSSSMVSPHWCRRLDKQLGCFSPTEKLEKVHRHW